MRVNGSSPADLRRGAAAVLMALARLEYNAEREDAAEPFDREALDLLADRSPDPATRMLRAKAQRDLSDIRLRQGRTADALALLESARAAFLELQSSGYNDKDLPNQIGILQERVPRAKTTGRRSGRCFERLSGTPSYQRAMRRAGPVRTRLPGLGRAAELDG